MRYYNDELSDDSSCCFDRFRGKVLHIRIGRKNPAWRMSFCHELGHVYMIPHQHHRRTIDSLGAFDRRLRYEIELLAWRIAKGMCKPAYWDEQLTLSYLKSYWHGTEAFPLEEIVPVTSKETILSMMKKIGIYRDR